MANLVDQINEMLNILEVMDPKAAAQFRGRSFPLSERPAGIPEQSDIRSYAAPSPKPAAPALAVPAAGTAESKAAAIVGSRIGLSGATLTQGIILSEILGKPVSKRRSREKK